VTSTAILGRPRPARTPRVVVLVVALGLGGLIAAAGPASAHDQLVGTDPADGSTVGAAPAQVTLTFGEPPLAIGTELQVTGPDGAKVQAGAPQITGSQVVQPLADGLPAGAYRVDWRVTAQDGHVSTGAFSFTAAAAAAATTTGPVPTTPTATPTATPTGPASTAEPTGTAVPLTSPATAPSTPGPSRTLVWLVVVAALLAVAAAGLVALRRRR
jgi:methionine-rich copper-binding protein CopC